MTLDPLRCGRPCASRNVLIQGDALPVQGFKVRARLDSLDAARHNQLNSRAEQGRGHTLADLRL